MKDDLRKDDYF